MAESYRFFTSVDSDRLYTAGQMNEYLYTMLGESNGVISGVDNELEVTNSGTLAVSIDTGAATKNGALLINDAALSKALNTLTSGYKRYDRIVVRDDETTARSFVVTIITGTATTGTPTVPAVVATTDVLLAKILIDRSSGTYVYTVTDEREYRPMLNTVLAVDGGFAGTNYGSTETLDGGTANG